MITKSDIYAQVPHHLKRRFHNMVNRLRELYPDGQIKDLYQTSRKLGETVAFFTNKLGFNHRSMFLGKIGFTLDVPKAGRPVGMSPQDAISLLKERYTPAKPASSFEELIVDNPDISFKTLQNKSREAFGMGFMAYLKELGILSDGNAEKKKKVSSSTLEDKLQYLIDELKRRYHGCLPLSISTQKLIYDNSDLRISALNNLTRQIHGETASAYLQKIGILAGQQEVDVAAMLAQLTSNIKTKYQGRMPLNMNLRELISDNTELPMTRLNNWTQQVHKATASSYLIREGILKFHGRSTSEVRRAQTKYTPQVNDWNGKTLVIPNGVYGIAAYALLNNKRLEVLVLPDTLLTIGAEAFAGCENLLSISFSETSQDIVVNDGAFCGCRSLTALDASNAVKSIGSNAFAYCEKLRDVKLPALVGEGAFAGCIHLETVQLSEQMLTIPARCFMGCSSLSVISLPFSLESIEEAAFRNCSSLHMNDLPDATTSIGLYAFSGCILGKRIAKRVDRQVRLSTTLRHHLDFLAEAEEINELLKVVASGSALPEHVPQAAGTGCIFVTHGAVMPLYTGHFVRLSKMYPTAIFRYSLMDLNQGTESTKRFLLVNGTILSRYDSTRFDFDSRIRLGSAWMYQKYLDSIQSVVDRFVKNSNNMSRGVAHEVVITAQGRVRCRGKNHFGECNLDNLERASAVSCGNWHTAVLNEDGRVVTSGSNRSGQCDVDLRGEKALEVSCGCYHTAVLLVTGQVLVFGRTFHQHKEKDQLLEAAINDAIGRLVDTDVSVTLPWMDIVRIKSIYGGVIALDKQEQVHFYGHHACDHDVLEELIRVQ